MFETPIHLIGNIVNDPIRRRVGEQELTKFRMASNSRRRTDEGTWEVSNTLYLTVTCWGALASGVGGSLLKGDPVVVVGTLYTDEYKDRDQNNRSVVEVKALSVGPDLTRCIARISTPRRSSLAEASGPVADAPSEDLDDYAGEDDDASAADGIEQQGLPLTA
jgi:single-strand DNA-binding protein